MAKQATSSWDAGQVLGVVPHLYVGALSAANDKQALKEHGITHVLTVGRRLSLSWNKQDNADQQKEDDNNDDKSRHILVHTVLVDDHPAENLLPHYQECCDFIKSAISTNNDSIGNGVLVHCASGISRSVAICCAYLMLDQKVTYTSALEMVRTNRPLAKPNFGFERQLQCTESCHYDLNLALQKWKELEAEQSSTETVRQSRERANAFHAEVDRFEEDIMSKNEGELLARQDKLLMELSMLQNRIDNILTDVVRDSVGDKPTKIILQSASSKANRLLGKLYSLDNNKRNPYS